MWYRNIVLSGFVRLRWPIWRMRIRGPLGSGELITASCTGRQAGWCTLLTWGSVLIWHVVPAVGRQRCIWIARAGAAEVRARWPRSGTGDIRLTGKTL